MIISEARLKQIIHEEVVDRLIEIETQKFITVLREELAKEGILLTETQDEATEAEAAAILEKELAAIKDDARKKWWKSTIKKAIAAGVSLTILLPFFHKVEVDAPAQDRAQTAAHTEASRSAQRMKDRLHDKLTNKDDLGGNWNWGAHDSMPREGDKYTFPTDPNDAHTALMPLEWSIGWDVYEDLNSDISKYPIPQELLQIIAAQPEITPEMDGKDKARVQDGYTKAALDYYKSIESEPSANFFTEFGPNDWEDAGMYGVHGYVSSDPAGMPAATYTLPNGAQALQDIQYVPAERIPDGYTMNNLLTPQQQYEKYKYVDFFPLEDFIEMKKSFQK